MAISHWRIYSQLKLEAPYHECFLCSNAKSCTLLNFIGLNSVLHFSKSHYFGIPFQSTKMFTSLSSFVSYPSLISDSTSKCLDAVQIFCLLCFQVYQSGNPAKEGVKVSQICLVPSEPILVPMIIYDPGNHYRFY